MDTHKWWTAYLLHSATSFEHSFVLYWTYCAQQEQLDRSAILLAYYTFIRWNAILKECRHNILDLPIFLLGQNTVNSHSEASEHPK